MDDTLEPKLPFPSLETVVKLIDECVAERGANYVYTPPTHLDLKAACLYMHGRNEPGCLIGCMLVKYGVDPEWLYLHNTTGINMKYREMFEDYSSPDQHRAFIFMIRVQQRQDAGVPWGNVVATVKNEMNIG